MTTQRFYVATYTQNLPHVPSASGKGIYQMELDPESGQLSGAKLVAELPNPTFVAVRPDGKTLLAVSETEHGAIFSYEIHDWGLRIRSAQSALEWATAFVSTDLSGQFAFAANYIGKTSVLAYPINADGALLPHVAVDCHEHHVVREPHEDPHAHCIRPHPGGRYMAATNLGTDEVYVYDLQGPDGPLSRTQIVAFPSCSGPRHIQFDASGTRAFVALELSSQVASLMVEPATGTMTLLNIASTLPAEAQDQKNTPSEVLVSPDGKFIYVGNRGHDSIAVFSVHPDTAELTLLENVSTQGEVPRGLVLSPDAHFLLAANQNSNSILVFKRNEETGILQAGDLFPCPSPVGLAFLP
ncbi:lactonase family protein [Deinococcus roseus]|uniref:6-phosphogluconolactonase n=1 Tax=Deinococcus roseus TaxID=392414 RepID=A0ABQ2DEQ1_9DEIO|nr:lactonase family protein [Deinococcus roseus]GGJ52985.1 hypothetical protein GCM10008938_43720 [Deinococcus roseus]